MIRKYIFGVFATLLALTLISTSVIAAAPEMVVTNTGLALLIGETDVAPGSPVIVQVVPKGEGTLTSDGNINGYVNETIVERDGKYKLLFSLEDIYEPGTEYECHVDLASSEYYVVSVTEGSLIEITSKDFDRDTKMITVAGSLWDSSAYGINLTLTIDGFAKTIQSSDDGKFAFEFTMNDAGITDYGVYNFVIEYADDSSSYCEETIELVNAGAVLEKVELYSKNKDELEKILTDSQNLKTLGFDSDILYGDCDLSELAGSGFFEKLSNTELKTDKVSELADSIKTAYALYNMEKNPSDKNLRRCIELFGIDSDDEITVIYDKFNDDTEPEYLFDIWADTNFTKIADAYAFYKDAVIRTKLNTAEAWSNLMIFVNDNHTLLGVDKQTSADFWQKLIYKSPFSSLADFKTKYNQVLNSKDDEPSGGGGSGSGGSGGGGSSGKGGFGISGTTSSPVTQLPQNTETKTVFKDINSNHWAAEAITKLYEMGIISGKGEGTYAPDDLVTRAEVAKLMCTSAKIDKEETAIGTFADVDSQHWAIGYIEAALANKLVTGTGNGMYAPEACTTREDMAVFCYRLLKIIKPESYDAVYVKEDLAFSDSNEIADYAMEAVAVMSKLGIINGKGNNKFDPKAYCTRAEAAKIFYGVLQ